MADKGATAKGFEELAVFQQARRLVCEVYELTRRGEFCRDFGLMDQIRRAAVSIVSNIAEGYERGTNNELIQFLYIAKGSCGEVRAQLMVACDLQYCDGLTHERLVDQARRISAGLANLIRHVKTSGYSGAKNKPVEKPLTGFAAMIENYVPPPLRKSDTPSSP